MQEKKDGTAWWEKVLGIKPGLTSGELGMMAGDEDAWQTSQEQMDAMRLIDIGKRTEDAETLEIGRARMRMLLGRPRPEDMEFFKS